MAQIGESASLAADPPAEPAPSPVQKKPLEIRISVFFDGTGNNRGNIQARQGSQNSDIYQKIRSQNSGEGDASAYSSFEAGFSNISLLEEQYKSTTECTIHKSFYVEGVATRDIREVADNYRRAVEAQQVHNENRAGRNQSKRQIQVNTDSSIVGNALAIGSTGLYRKVDKAFNELYQWFLNDVHYTTHDGEEVTPQTHEIAKFVVDVFGFSRGAATARHFIHHLLETNRTVVLPMAKILRSPFSPPSLQTMTVTTPTLKQRLEDLMYTVKDDAVQIGFAGLFDTVSSYVIALTSDVRLLHLDAVTRARKVYHLAAAEEHRAAFSLTNIKSAKNAGIGEEYFLPGVHSDIGGGYRDLDDGDGEHEQYDLMNNHALTIGIMQAITDASLTLNYREFTQKLADEGWYKPSSPIDWVSEDEVNPSWEMWLEKEENFFSRDLAALKVNRCGIAHSYRYIPLQLMAEEMEKNDFTFKSSLRTKYQVPGQLAAVDQRIRSYIGGTGNSKPEDWFKKQDPQLKDLRNKHLHYSSRIENGFWPRFVGRSRYRQPYDG